MEPHDDVQSRRFNFARDAVITFVAVVVAFIALDDITTDVTRGVSPERIALAGCAAWFLFLAWQFWRQRQRLLAVLSFGLVALAAVAQPAIRRGTDPFQFEYLSTIAALAWFLLMAGVLAGFAWYRAHTRAHA